MARLEDHPTALAVRGRRPPGTGRFARRGMAPPALPVGGADDVGFVEIERRELADERHHIFALFRRRRRSSASFAA